MRNTRDRSITHKLAKMSFDQIFDLEAGAYFYIKCDLNLLKTLPRPEPPDRPRPTPLFFFPAPSCSNAPPNIEICQSNKTFNPLDITSLSF